MEKIANSGYRLPITDSEWHEEHKAHNAQLKAWNNTPRGTVGTFFLGKKEPRPLIPSVQAYKVYRMDKHADNLEDLEHRIDELEERIEELEGQRSY